MLPEKYKCDGQMDIFEYLQEKKPLKRNCSATLEICETECYKVCCQRCADFSCGKRCKYSKGRPQVLDGGTWVDNMSYRNGE